MAPDKWLQGLLSDLAASGEIGRRTAERIRDRNIQLKVHAQPTGARWKLGRIIEISPRLRGDAASGPYALSLIVHEVRHILQGPVAALSVHGELEAWQDQFTFLRVILADPTQIPGDREAIERLLALPVGWHRSVLGEARMLMARYAGPAYRIGWLPLFPLHYELIYALTKRPPPPRGEPLP